MAEAPDDAMKRTKMVSVRLTPKLRFAADIAARFQRRTVSSLLEVGVAHYLTTLDVTEPGYNVGDKRPAKLMELVESLWDPDESDRFVTLAEKQRWLLNNEEDHRWKAIQEHLHAKGHLTQEQRKALRSIYAEIKDRVAAELDEKGMTK